jgi:antitoxin HigA-1
MKRIVIHPGEILSKDVFPAAGLDVKSAAKILEVSEQYLQSVLNQEAPVTKAMSQKLGEYLKNSPAFWENLQKAHDDSVLSTDNAKKRNGHFKKQRGPK